MINKVDVKGIFKQEFTTTHGRINFLGVFLVFLSFFAVAVPTGIQNICCIIILHKEPVNLAFSGYLKYLSPSLIVLALCLYFIAWQDKNLNTGNNFIGYLKNQEDEDIDD